MSPDARASVVIPVLDGAAFLDEAVANVESQGVAREIIVVDDGSTDSTPAVAERLGDRIRYRRQRPSGPGAARNTGLDLAVGDVVAFLDVDDVWPAGSLAARLATLDDDPTLDAVLGRTQLLVAGEHGRWAPYAAPFHALAIPPAAFRRRAFDRAGVFDTGYRTSEDFDWFLRARDVGVSVGRINAVCSHYRRHGANLTFGALRGQPSLARALKASLDRRRADRG